MIMRAALECVAASFTLRTLTSVSRQRQYSMQAGGTDPQHALSLRVDPQKGYRLSVWTPRRRHKTQSRTATAAARRCKMITVELHGAAYSAIAA